MGSPKSESGRRYNEGPVHRVTFARPFAVGVYEVTFGEWDACVSGGGCRRVYVDRFHVEQAGGPLTRHPVINVRWEDAKRYVEWLSRETGEGYRLLSESEWEYVARAGTKTSRYWGESEVDQCDYANGSDREVKRRLPGRRETVDCVDGHYMTAPVGSFRANDWGLHDVLGNVSEWVEDCWNRSYRGAPSDGSAWESGRCSIRPRGGELARGGSWYSVPWALRSAARLWLDPVAGSSFDHVGFRVARTLD